MTNPAHDTKEAPDPSQPHLLVRPDWLAQVAEPAIDPARPIIDPHHHLWNRQGAHYLLPDLLEDLAAGHTIEATVFLECRSMYRAGGDPDLQCVGETEFVAGVAAMSESGGYGPTRICAGIVGYAELGLGNNVGRVLEAHVAASGGRLRGIRNGTTHHPDPASRGAMVNRPPGMLGDAKFRQGFALLAKHDLSFDSWLYYTQMDELADLARAFPETKIVLNHCGGILAIGPYKGRRDEVFRDWKAAMGRLAQCPNVSVKLGGLGMRMLGFDFESRPRPPTSEEVATAWRPYIETAIEAFGPARGMFESNFPVDKPSCSYGVLWNAFKRISAPYCEAEKSQLFRETARRIYRL